MKIFFIVCSFSLMYFTGYAQDVWQQTNGPGHQSWTIIHKNDTVFTGTVDGYVFRSINDGLNWTQAGARITDNGQSPAIQSLSINSRGYVLVGTHRWGIYLSTDGGNQWQKVTGNLPSFFLAYSVVINENGDLFVGGDMDSLSGIYRSVDNGVTWTRIFSSSYSGFGGYALSLDKEGKIFAAAYDSVYCSTDKGNTWSVHKVGSSSSVITLFSNGDGRIFAGTSSSGIYYSTDSGEIWNLSTLTTGGIDAFAQHSNDTCYAGRGIGPLGGGPNYAGAVYISTDNGVTWNKNDTGLPGGAVYALTVNTKGRVFACVGNSTNVYRSVMNPAVIGGDATISLGLLLGQNYPNPFSQQTTILVNGKGSFEVRDVLGRVMYQMKINGEKQITFDRDNLSNGLYEYSLSDGANVQSRMMMIVK